MSSQIVFFILVAFLAVKWGYELVSGKKLRKNLVGEPLATRQDNPQAYWMYLLLEVGIVFVVGLFVVFSER